MSNLNPWIALLIGLIVGMLAEWLFEVLYFRRQRLACQRELAQVRDDLQARTAELAATQARMEALEDELSRRERRTAEPPAAHPQQPAAPASAAEQWESETEAADVAAAVGETVAPRDEFGSVEEGEGEGEGEDEREDRDEDERGGEGEGEGFQSGAKAAVVAGAVGETVMPRDEYGSMEGGAVPVADFSMACPQDLSAVKGIGSVYERKLYAAGIGSYWELANTDDAQLGAIFEVKAFQDVDFTAIREGAQAMAEKTGSVGRSWDGSQPDDFETLEGIGATYERRLYDAGICTWAALAEATVEQLAAICQAPDWRRPNYARWIEQAREQLGAS